MTNSGSSYAYGGAIYGSSVLNIEGGDFVNCSCRATSSSARGGSIYADSSSTCDIASAIFMNCSAVSQSYYADGGAVYTDSTCSITNTSFVNCSAVSQSSGAEGGAIHIHSTCNIMNTSFVNCSAVSQSSWAEGGAVYTWSSSTCTITGSTFVNCTSIGSSGSYGGAIRYNGKLSIMKCIIDNCTAKTGDYGGALNGGTNANGFSCISCSNNGRSYYWCDPQPISCPTPTPTPSPSDTFSLSITFHQSDNLRNTLSFTVSHLLSVSDRVDESYFYSVSNNFSFLQTYSQFSITHHLTISMVFSVSDSLEYDYDYDDIECPDGYVRDTKSRSTSRTGSGSSVGDRGGDCVECSKLIENCLRCNESSSGSRSSSSSDSDSGSSIRYECLECDRGYTLVNDRCVLCSDAIDNCGLCDGRSKTSTYISTSNSSKSENENENECIECNKSIEGCLVCSSRALEELGKSRESRETREGESRCLRCSESYTKTIDGLCDKCSSQIEHCSFCSSVIRKCLFCEFGYYLYNDTFCDRCSNRFDSCSYCSSRECLIH